VVITNGKVAVAPPAIDSSEPDVNLIHAASGTARTTNCCVPLHWFTTRIPACCSLLSASVTL
jgi:hypothetical protein